MPAQIIAETPVAGYVAPVLEIVGPLPTRRSRLTRRAEPAGTGFQLPPRATWSPAVNVFDTGDAFVVIAELAGVGPDSLRIELDAGADTVTLRGQRLDSAPAAADVCDAVGTEIASGRFERLIHLGEPVDVRGARAVCRYGLLELMLPKLGRRQPKRAPLRRPQLRAAC